MSFFFGDYKCYLLCFFSLFLISDNEQRIFYAIISLKLHKYGFNFEELQKLLLDTSNCIKKLVIGEFLLVFGVSVALFDHQMALNLFSLEGENHGFYLFLIFIIHLIQLFPFCCKNKQKINNNQPFLLVVLVYRIFWRFHALQTIIDW